MSPEAQEGKTPPGNANSALRSKAPGSVPGRLRVESLCRADGKGVGGHPRGVQEYPLAVGWLTHLPRDQGDTAPWIEGCQARGCVPYLPPTSRMWSV